MLSIIIPVFNEEAQLPKLLEHLSVASAGLIKEIIVVDGGSTDRTARIAKDHPKVFTFLQIKGGRCK